MAPSPATLDADSAARTATVAEVEAVRRAAIDAGCVAALRRLANEIRALPPTPVADLRAALAAVTSGAC